MPITLTIHYFDMPPFDLLFSGETTVAQARERIQEHIKRLEPFGLYKTSAANGRLMETEFLLNYFPALTGVLVCFQPTR
jgi:hypothetical protein